MESRGKTTLRPKIDQSVETHVPVKLPLPHGNILLRNLSIIQLDASEGLP